MRIPPMIWRLRVRAVLAGLLTTVVLLALSAACWALILPPWLDTLVPSSGLMRSVTVRVGSLQMSLQLPRGPFFADELLPVTVSLVNHSRKVFTYTGRVWAEITGGVPSPIPLPDMGIASGPAPSPVLLLSGQTLTIHLLVPLTSSGQVRVRAVTRFFSMAGTGIGGLVAQGSAGPFRAGWPTLTISVASHAPLGRALYLLHIGPVTFVTGPATALAHLVYQYAVSCSPGMSSGNYTWQPLHSPIIRDPGCPGGNETWSPVVGAPGYAIVW